MIVIVIPIANGSICYNFHVHIYIYIYKQMLDKSFGKTKIIKKRKREKVNVCICRTLSRDIYLKSNVNSVFRSHSIYYLRQLALEDGAGRG